MEVVIVSANDAQGAWLTTSVEARGHTVTLMAHDAVDASALAVSDVQLIIIDAYETAALGLCRTIREQAPKTVLLLALQDPDETAIDAAMSAGADDFLTKPYQAGDVSGRLLVAERTVKDRVTKPPARSSKTILDVVEHSPVGIARIREADGSIVDANPELCRMLGLPADQVRGASAQFLVSMVEPAASHSREALSLDLSRKSEPFNLLRPDNKTVRILLSATRYEDDEGWFTVLILHDVTEREQLRHQLLLAERMASLGMLAAGVAHEINNPLSYTMTNLHYVSEMLSSLAGKVDTEGQETLFEDFGVRYPVRAMLDALNEAIDGSGRVRDIVRQLRDFSRSDEALEEASVEQIIERALLLVSNELRHRARIVSEFGATGAILTNPGKLGQVIVNLLVNASQALEGKPQDNEIKITTRRQGDNVEIDVADNGRGIPAENLQRIFEPFFTTKAVGVGTGLGLSICHALVASLGGRIEASSTGRGALFRITLPATTATARPQVTAELAKGQEKAPRGRLLVIDDEPGLGRSLQRLLSRSHDIAFITSARDALAQLLAGESFDLIFCDIMMPEMSGIELFGALKESRPDLADKLVFITGGAFTPNARSFLESVSNDRLYKPIDIHELRRVVAHRLSIH